MLLPTLFFILGVVYGYLHPGKENRIGMLKKAIGIGVLLGIVFGFVAMFLLPGILGVFVMGVSVIAFVIAVLMVAIPFIVGTIFGDLLEHIL